MDNVLSTSINSFSDLLPALVDKLETWAESAVAALPNLVVAVLVLTAFWWISGLTKRTVNRLLGEVVSSRQIALLLASTAKVGVLAAGLFIALGVLNLDKTVMSLLAGAGVVGLALGFAFKDIAANYLSGIIIALRRPMSIGDYVYTNDYEGFVDRIDLRTTRLRLRSGELVIIPNRLVLEAPIKNFTCEGERRLAVPVGISYGDDPDKAERAALEAVRHVDGVDPDREPEVVYTGFGGSSIDLEVRVWLTEPMELPRVRSRVIKAINSAFRDNDISIPFPIRTLDFGIEGGVRLAEELPRFDRTADQAH